MDIFDRDENPMYGDWIEMGQLSADWFIACISETAKRLIEQMQRSVNPTSDITLIFKLNPTSDEGTYNATGAWKCRGTLKNHEEGVKWDIRGGKMMA